MRVLNKQSCPMCGQSVNERQIALFSGMVKSLAKVFKWCIEKDVTTFSRKDIKHLLTTDNEIARFGDWVYFGNIIHRRGKGEYALDLDAAYRFLVGRDSIPTVVYKNPLNKSIEIENESYMYINQIPHLGGFLNERQEYVAVYRSSDTWQQTINL